MDTELKRDIREFKERELYLHSLQKEYNRQTGLSFSGSNTPVQSINLPLHPTTLQKELDDYKDYAGRLEEALIQRETKEKFLRFILQDPPHEISTDEYVSAEKKAIDLERQIRANQEKMNDLKNTIKQKTSRVETLHSRISTDVDQLTRIIDDIEKNTKLLEQVETQLDQQTGLSLDEAMKIEEQLTDEIIQVNMDIDERRDRISRMKKEATENQRIVDELETRWEGLKQEASSRQVYTEQHLQKLNEATHRFEMVTRERNHMVGVDEFITKPNGFIVRFANDRRDELNIIIKNDKFEDATVTTRACSIHDLVQLAKSHRSLDQSINSIIYGTLARLKNYST